MKIYLRDQYISLAKFEPIDLPDFTLITGLNGSGKTHLLKALNLGAANIIGIVADDRNINQDEYRKIVPYFTASDFAISNSNTYEQFNNLSDRDNTADWVDENFHPQRSKWSEWGVQNGLSADDLKRLTIASLSGAPVDLSEDLNIQQGLRDFLNTLTEPPFEVRTAIPSQHSDGVQRAKQTSGLPTYLLSRSDVETAFLDNTPFFSSSLVAIFSRYRDRIFRNRHKKIALDEGQDVRPLSKLEFERQYGPPPWDVINETLEQLKLSITVEPPDTLGLSPYTPRMKTKTGETIAPGELSSGERVILNLALCGYQQNNKTERIQSAKVVLLDEVDSPLHPSMVKTFLSVISETLINKFGMKVIATTHSPSTVALFPGRTVFVMEKGVAGLSEVSRAEALNTLTAGVPTLSVSIDGRRQVFAESPVEANNLEQLYQRMKGTLSSERSLQFIATGTKHANSSCDIVKRIVGELVSTGNETVYGMIDWDLTNNSTDRLIVVAQNKRRALENVLLDPLIIVLAIYRYHSDRVGKFGLDTRYSYSDVAALDPSILQPLVNIVLNRLFESPAESSTRVRYEGGFELDIDERFLRHPPHELDVLVAKKFPMFEGIQQSGSGRLTEHMVTKVLDDAPGCLPIEIREAFEEALR